ncbi:His-Xaa-Ser system radical SAM maturase HxsC [Thiobacillus denitrificans]|uniref:His-Xaa-Ser system radical SAM maturase HxsC n=1 Tax=Thiobacillus denitrificans TaxID=36861 RepID=UPI00036A6733|nr:His-Xaa-Ser system radical SAM maturase HxsC [Thiobacillus denitrificans]
MRTAPADIKGFAYRTVMRVTELPTVAREWRPDLNLLVRVASSTDMEALTQLGKAGVSNLALLTAEPSLYEKSEFPSVLELVEPLNEGDVAEVTPGRTGVHVLFRESDVHHTVFLTNRCNSRCLMCSQPPTRQDDSWLADEAIRVAMHMRISPKTVGFTGGEPLILGGKLREVIDAFATSHPDTKVDLLTNGRLLADPLLAHDLLSDMRHPITWLVPLYGHADFLHDFVVQAPGAFDQTIGGLLTLHSHGQRIQLRIVLVEPVLRYLPELCEFICRNLPFVSEVALMGCEPIGFALANRDTCEVDIFEWGEELEVSVKRLVRGGLFPVLMNLPLCTIQPELWRYAHQSISDWKRTFVAECDSCVVKNNCSGLFAWHEKGWRPATIKAIREG